MDRTTYNFGHAEKLQKTAFKPNDAKRFSESDNLVQKTTLLVYNVCVCVCVCVCIYILLRYKK
jgi:hypothetical protein